MNTSLHHSCSTQKPALQRGIVLLCLAGAIALPLVAAADCTPGYKDSVNFHCDHQAQAPSSRLQPGAKTKSDVPMATAAVPMACPPDTQRYQGHCVPVPHRPGKAGAQTGAADEHGIIFVGGKQALNPQPIPPGKSSLNPQPIPPGHVKTPVPPPGTPIEKRKHWDLKANKES